MRFPNGLVHSRLVGEGLWVSVGQALSAVGLILGIRLQTEFIPPEVYGSAVLLVGISALVVGIACSPFAQGALRFLPQAVESRQENQFRWAMWKLVARNVVLAEIAMLFGVGGWTLLYGGPVITIFILAGMLIADSARTIEMAFYNGMRRQRVYAAWAVAEAWGRPILAVAFVWLYGAHAWTVLSGYLAASTLNFFLFGCAPLIHAKCNRKTETTLAPHLIDTVRKYSRPLMPLGLVGWVSSLSDRYLIAGIIGVQQAGVYAAIYGLISRPFLMVQSTLELTLRPVYFQAAAAGDRRREWRLYSRWLTLNTLAGIMLILFFISASQLIVEYLLGEQYKKSIVLIPYLAIGHLLLITAYNLNSYLYAHQCTKEIFFVSAVTAVVSVAIVALFANLWGLIGAGIACIAYFGVQASILFWFIWQRERRPEAV